MAKPPALVTTRRSSTGAGDTRDEAELSRAQRTMFDMRALAIAFEAYSVDHGLYPKAESIEDFAKELSPTYIAVPPLRDAWGNPLHLHVSRDRGSYLIVSAGSDGSFSPPSWTKAGEFTDTTEDCLYSDGKFLRLWTTGPGR